MMHQRKGKQILIYFFLFILVGSINNIDINKLTLKKVTNIKILGLNDKESQIFLSDIESLNLNNIFFLNEKKIHNMMNNNTTIENYNIFKKYPSDLEIKVKKTNFLAKMNRNGKTFLIGSNGKLSGINLSNEDLPFIFGQPDIQEFLKFKEILDQTKLPYSQIKTLYFFQSKRWDIELKNKILIKLPKIDVQNSLKNVFIFLNDNKIRNINVIDARIKNQIIINE